jgi:hypothetical protein
MYGVGKNQIPFRQGGARPMSLWRGRKTMRNRGGFCEAGTHRKGTCRAGILCLQAAEGVNFRFEKPLQYHRRYHSSQCTLLLWRIDGDQKFKPLGGAQNFSETAFAWVKSKR